MKKYLVYSNDFKPHKGGIAEFVYNISVFLNSKKQLEAVITTTPSENLQFDFPVLMSNLRKTNRNLGQRLGDNFFLTRKLNTLIHKIKLYYLAFKDLKSFRKKNIRVLVCSYYTYDTGIWINVCKRLNIDYEILYHGLDILNLSKQLPRQFKKNSKNSKRLIFNSLATKNLFIKKLPDVKTQKQIIYPYIDTKKILQSELYSKEELAKKWNIDLQNKRIISTVAALVKRKGVSIAVNSMKKLVEHYPDTIYIIGGKGPEFENLKKQVEELGLKDNVFLLGIISDKEKWALLKYSEIFVLPSSGLNETDWEGFGISYIEASLFENVVIGGKHGGIPEAVDDNKSGYLIDFDKEGSDIKLFEKIRYIIENDHSHMRQYGKRFVIDNFDIKNFEGKF